MTSAVAEFSWNPDLVIEEFLYLAEETLVITCINVALYAKVDPPYKTGRYQRSIRVIEPGYEGDDTADATTEDLLTTDIEQLREEIVDGHLAVGSFISYAYSVQVNAKNPDQRYNIQQAVDAKGTQEDYDYNLHIVKSKYGVH